MACAISNHLQRRHNYRDQLTFIRFVMRRDEDANGRMLSHVPTISKFEHHRHREKAGGLLIYLDAFN